MVLGLSLAAGCGGQVDTTHGQPTPSPSPSATIEPSQVPTPTAATPQLGGTPRSTIDAGTTPPAPTGTPVVLATGLYNPWGLVVDDTTVYVADVNANTVSSVPIAGGALTVLASAQFSPWKIALRSGTLYFTTFYGVSSMPAGGGPVTTLTAASENVRSLALGPSQIVFVDSQDDSGDEHTGLTESVPFTGGAPTELARSLSDVDDVATDGTSVYWTSTGGELNASSGLINKAPIGGGPTTVLASGQVLPYAILVDGDDVFFAGAFPANVSRVSTHGGPVTVLSSEGVTPDGLAVDAEYVYWADANEGTICRVPRNGGASTVLAVGQNAPGEVAVDATNIYWTNTGPLGTGSPITGSVMKLAKAGDAAPATATP